MIFIQTYDPSHLPATAERGEIATFLFHHLDTYGDPQPDIEKAIDYALGKDNAPGGLVLTARSGDTLTGAVVVNRTGMRGYIPENILVYIATHSAYRGRGIGRRLMEEAISRSAGDMALHVEPENPAKLLYESLGFTNKYLEMRLKKEK